MRQPVAAPDMIDETQVPPLRRGGYGLSRSGRRLIRAFESGGDESELEKGRRLARRGAVLSLCVQSGLISAEITPEGPDRSPVRVRTALPAIPVDARENLLAACAATAEGAGEILNRRIPPQMIESGLLLPAATDLQRYCSDCGTGVLCRHIATLESIFIDRLNDDELLLLRWRGFTGEATTGGSWPIDTAPIIAAVRVLRGWPASPPAAAEPAGQKALAWNRLGPIPHLPQPATGEAVSVIDQLGLPVFFPESERNLLTTLKRLQEDA